MKQISKLKFTFLGIAIILFSITSVQAQNDSTVVWKKNFGGSGGDCYRSVTAVSDGIIAVGNSGNGSFGNGDWASIIGKSGNSDAIIVKYDNSGNVAWKKNFGGSDWNYYYSVTAVSDGIIAVGNSGNGSFGNGDWAGIAGKGWDDAIIVKYDNSGNVVWKKNFGGNYNDHYYSVTQVSDGVIAVGYSFALSFGNGDWAGIAGKGNSDAIIVKYDKNGNVVWKKNFGGSSEDYYYSVTTVSDGIIAAGRSNMGSFSNGDWAGIAGKGNYDAIIVKYDNSGNVVWKKNFGGNYNDHYYSVTPVSDGIIAVGYSYSGSFNTGDWAGVAGKGDDNAIIVKYDNSGNVVWKKNFGGSGGDYYEGDRYESVTTVSDGVIAVGRSGSFNTGDWAGVAGKGSDDVIIVKYDNSGNVVWKKNFGGSGGDIYNSVTAVSDGIIAVGYSYVNNTGDWAGIAGKGGNDAIIVKYGRAICPSAAVKTYSDTICENGIYSDNYFKNLTMAKKYTDTLRSVHGCDSLIVNFTLYHYPSVTVKTYSDTICENGTYSDIYFKNLTIAKIYTDTLRSVHGCDSLIVNFTLHHYPSVAVKTYSDTICENGTYSDIYFQNLTVAKKYTDTLRSIHGCDSLIVNFTLYHYPSVAVHNYSASIYQGEIYQDGNFTNLTLAGVYYDTLQNVNGCDSVVCLTLTVNIVAVTDIIDLPANAMLNVLLPLTDSVTVLPSNATNQTIVWTIIDAGTTNAKIITDNSFYATAEGIALMKATIVNGKAAGENYEKAFTITVSNVGIVSATLNNQLRVYPNPAGNQLTIEYGAKGEHAGSPLQIEIFDVVGQRVGTYQFPSFGEGGGEVVIDISHFPFAKRHVLFENR